MGTILRVLSSSPLAPRQTIGLQVIRCFLSRLITISDNGSGRATDAPPSSRLFPQLNSKLSSTVSTLVADAITPEDVNTAVTTSVNTLSLAVATSIVDLSAQASIATAAVGTAAQDARDDLESRVGVDLGNLGGAC